MSRRAGVLVVVLVTAVVIGSVGIVMAHAAADQSRDPSVSARAATDAEREARLFWDNPFQRMLYFGMSMTKVRPGSTCPTFEVTAFTFFGAVIDRVLVNCTGVHR